MNDNQPPVEEIREVLRFLHGVDNRIKTLEMVGLGGLVDYLAELFAGSLHFCIPTKNPTPLEKMGLEGDYIIWLESHGLAFACENDSFYKLMVSEGKEESLYLESLGYGHYWTFRREDSHGVIEEWRFHIKR